MHPRNQEVSASLITTMSGKPHLELTVELRILGADGQWRWVNTTVRGSGTGGEPLSVTIRRLPGPTADILALRHEPNDALLESEARFRLLADAAPIGVFQEYAGGADFYVNRRWEQITGLTREEAAQESWVRILHPDDVEATLAAYHRAQRTGTDRRQARFRIIRPDGVERWVEVGYAATLDDRGEPAATLGTIEDVTDAVVAVNRSDRLTHALEATPDLVAIWDAVERTVLLNEAARRFLGSEDTIPDSEMATLLPASLLDGWLPDVLPDLIEDGVWTGEIAVPDVTGRVVPLSVVYLARQAADGSLIGVAAICRDISEFKVLEARLAHQATHDPLTGLPNRILLRDRIEGALTRTGGDHRTIAVLFLDLDRFKVVNDSLGHAFGDQALVMLASRIEAAMRPGEMVARFGGDEFVVLAEDLPDADAAVLLADRLAAVVAEPLEIGDHRFVVSVSIGVTTSGRAGDDPDALVRDADAAMYRAKAHGGSRHQVFDAETRAETVDRLDLESDLRRAIESDELVLHYQPKVALESGRIVGFEALVRWQHPTRGLLLPDRFLPVAGESNLMPDLGAWVVDRAFAALPRLDAARPGGDPPLYLCVNLSAFELTHPAVVSTVVGATERHGVDPSRIDLELTEHTLMKEASSNSDALGQLSALGYQIAIDDFGTGYSSLAYLRTFPVNLLKIDRTFVVGLGTSSQDTAIVTAVLAMAGSLGLTVVAEGVETAEQLAELRRLGCAMAQGHHIAAAMTLDEALALVASSPVW